VRLFVSVFLTSSGMIICTLGSTAQHRLTRTNKGVIPVLIRALSIMVVWFALRILSPATTFTNLLPILLILSSLIGSRMTVYGLTGGIACGKSTVSAELIRHNWTVIDADKISHEIMDTDEELKRLVISTFGDEVVDLKDNGKFINRTKLGSIIFANPQKRKQLNALTHPRIFREIFS